MRTLLAATLSVLALIASPVQADFSIGGSAGYVEVEGDADDLDFDGSDVGFKVFGRYMFNEGFGIEGGYIDFGEPDEDVLGQNLAIDANGWNLFLVGNLPLSNSFDLFAKAGAVHWDADSIIDGIEVGSDDGTDLALGGGLRWNLSESLSFRGEVDWYDVDDIDQAWMASVGLEIRF